MDRLREAFSLLDGTDQSVLLAVSRRNKPLSVETGSTNEPITLSEVIDDNDLIHIPDIFPLSITVTMAILCGRQVMSARITSSIVENALKVPHEILLVCVLMILRAPIRQERPLSTSLFDLPMECHDLIMNHPDYDSCCDQSIDVFHVVNPGDLLSISIALSALATDQDRQELTRILLSGTPVLLIGDVFIGRNVARREDDKETKYLVQRNVLRDSSTSADGQERYHMMVLQLGFPAAQAEFDVKANRIIQSLTASGNFPAHNLNIVQKLMRVAIRMRRNADELIERLGVIYGRDTIARILKWKFTQETPSHVTKAKFDAIKQNLIDHRTYGNNMSEINRLCGEADDDETNIIWNMSKTAADDLLTDHLSRTCLDQAMSRPWKYSVPEKFDKNQILGDLRKEQISRTDGLIPRRDKAVMSIPCFRTDASPNKAVRGDARLKLGVDRSLWPETDHIISKSMDVDTATQIVYEISMQDGVLNDTSILEYTSPGGLTSESKLALAFMNGLHKAKNTASGRMRFMPVNLFAPGVPLDTMKRSLGLDEASLGQKAVKDLIRYQFSHLGKTAVGKRKRRIDWDYKSVPERELAKMGIGKNIWMQKNPKDKIFTPSSFVPIDADNNNFEDAIFTLLRVDESRHRSGDFDVDRAKFANQIRAQMDPPENLEEKTRMDIWIERHSRFLATSSGQICKFLSRLAFELNLSINRHREKDQAHVSSLGDGIWVFIFGKPVNPEDSHNFVSYMIVADETRNQLVTESERVCNNWTKCSFVSSGKHKKFIHSKVLAMPVFAMRVYLSMFQVIKNASTTYRSRTAHFLKQGNENDLTSAFGAMTNRDTIPEVLTLLLSRVNLNTGLWLSLGRYVDMHSKGTNHKLTSFAAQKLNIPVRHQQDMFILKRQLNHAQTTLGERTNEKGGSVMTEDTSAKGAKQDDFVDCPSMYFDVISDIQSGFNLDGFPDPDKHYRSSLSRRTSVLRGNLTMNIFEYYFVNAFSEETENAYFDSQVVVDAAFKVDVKITDGHYATSRSASEFSSLLQRWKELGKPEVKDFPITLRRQFDQHYEPARCRSLKISELSLWKSLCEEVDLNYHYKLNSLEDFRFWETGLSSDGSMSGVMEHLDMILEERDAAPTGTFSAPMVSVGKRMFFQRIVGESGSAIVDSLVKSNPFRLRKITEFATFKVAVASNCEKPIPCAELGHDPERMTEWISTNLAKRTKRIVFIANAMLSIALGLSPDCSHIGDMERGDFAPPQILSKIIELVAAARLKILSSGEHQKFLDYNSAINQNDLTKLKYDTTLFCVLREAMESLDKEDRKVVFGDLEKEALKEMKEMRSTADWQKDADSLAHETLKQHYLRCTEAFQNREFQTIPHDPTGEYVDHKTKEDLTEAQLTHLQKVVEEGKTVVDYYSALIRETKNRSDLKKQEKHELVRSYKTAISAAKSYHRSRADRVRTDGKNKNTNEAYAIVQKLTEMFEAILSEEQAGCAQISQKISVEQAKVIALFGEVLEKHLREKTTYKDLTKRLGAESKTEEIAGFEISDRDLAGLAERDDSCLRLHEVATNLLEIAKVYEEVQWFKKPQYTGVRPISILSWIGGILQADRESIGRQEDALDSRSTLSDPLKYEHLTGALSRLNTCAQDKKKLGKVISKKEQSFDGEKWCGLMGPPVIIANRAPLRETDPSGTDYSTANQLRMAHKQCELPRDTVKTWVGARKNQSRRIMSTFKSAMKSDRNFETHRKRFLCDFKPTVVVRNGMLEGIDHYGSTGLQRAACELRAECSIKALNILKNLDKRLIDFEIDREDLYGSDDAFVGRVLSIRSMSDVLKDVRKRLFGIKKMRSSEVTEDIEMYEYVKDMIPSDIDQMPSDIDSLLDMITLHETNEQLMKQMALDDYSGVPIEDSVKLAEELQSSMDGIKIMIGGDERHKTYLGKFFLPLTDRELLALCDEILNNVEDACFRVCCIKPSVKSIHSSLIKEYNSIFSSREGQATALIKYVMAASKLFNAMSPSEAVEETHGKLSQLCENTVSTQLYYDVLFDNELTFNLMYSCAPGTKNHWSNFTEPNVNPDLVHYAFMKFPRLNKQQSETIGLNFTNHKCLTTSDEILKRNNKTILRTRGEAEDAHEDDPLDELLLCKPKLSLRKSAGYRKFSGWFEKGGITRDLADRCIISDPHIGLGYKHTILDHLFGITQVVYSSGAVKAFKTGTSGSDVQMAASSISGRVFLNPDKKDSQNVTLNDWFRIRKEMSKKEQDFSGKSLKALLPDDVTFQALDRLRNWREENKVSFRVTSETLRNPRYTKQRKRAEQSVGEIPTSHFLLKHWFGWQPETPMSEGAVKRTLSILKKHVPQMALDFSSFCSQIGYTNYFGSNNQKGSSREDREDHLADLKSKRNLIQALAQKIRFRSSYMKSFTRFGPTSTLDQFLKNSLSTSEDSCKNTIAFSLIKNDVISLEEQQFSNSGMVEDATILLWNLLVCYPNLAKNRSQVSLGKLVTSGVISLLHQIKTMDLPGDLSSFRHQPFQCKMILAKICSDVLKKRSDQNLNKTILNYLFSDFSKRGFVVVLESSSEDSSAGEKPFCCASFHSEGFVKLSVTGSAKDRVAEIVISNALSRANVVSGITSVLAYFLNSSQHVVLEQLINNMQNMGIKFEVSCNDKEKILVVQKAAYRKKDRMRQESRSRISCEIEVGISDGMAINFLSSVDFKTLELDHQGSEIILQSQMDYSAEVTEAINVGYLPAHTVRSKLAVLRRADLSFLPKNSQASLSIKEVCKSLLGPRFTEHERELEGHMSRTSDEAYRNSSASLRRSLQNRLNLNFHSVIFNDCLSNQDELRTIIAEGITNSPSQIMMSLLQMKNLKKDIFTRLLGMGFHNIGKVSLDTSKLFLEEEMARFHEEAKTEAIERDINRRQDALRAISMPTPEEVISSPAMNISTGNFGLLGVARSSPSERPGYHKMTIGDREIWICLGASPVSVEDLRAGFFSRVVKRLGDGFRQTAIAIDDVIGRISDSDILKLKVSSSNIDATRFEKISGIMNPSVPGAMASQVLIWCETILDSEKHGSSSHKILHACNSLIRDVMARDRNEQLESWNKHLKKMLEAGSDEDLWAKTEEVMRELKRMILSMGTHPSYHLLARTMWVVTTYSDTCSDKEYENLVNLDFSCVVSAHFTSKCVLDPNPAELLESSSLRSPEFLSSIITHSYPIHQNLHELWSNLARKTDDVRMLRSRIKHLRSEIFLEKCLDNTASMLLLTSLLSKANGCTQREVFRELLNKYPNCPVSILITSADLINLVCPSIEVWHRNLMLSPDERSGTDVAQRPFYKAYSEELPLYIERIKRVQCERRLNTPNVSADQLDESIRIAEMCTTDVGQLACEKDRDTTSLQSMVKLTSKLAGTFQKIMHRIAPEILNSYFFDPINHCEWDSDDQKLAALQSWTPIMCPHDARTLRETRYLLEENTPEFSRLLLIIPSDPETKTFVCSPYFDEMKTAIEEFASKQQVVMMSSTFCSLELKSIFPNMRCVMPTDKKNFSSLSKHYGSGHVTPGPASFALSTCNTIREAKPSRSSLAVTFVGSALGISNLSLGCPNICGSISVEALDLFSTKSISLVWCKNLFGGSDLSNLITSGKDHKMIVKMKEANVLKIIGQVKFDKSLERLKSLIPIGSMDIPQGALDALTAESANLPQEEMRENLAPLLHSTIAKGRGPSDNVVSIAEAKSALSCLKWFVDAVRHRPRLLKLASVVDEINTMIIRLCLLESQDDCLNDGSIWRRTEWNAEAASGYYTDVNKAIVTERILEYKALGFCRTVLQTDTRTALDPNTSLSTKVSLYERLCSKYGTDPSLAVPSALPSLSQVEVRSLITAIGETEETSSYASHQIIKRERIKMSIRASWSKDYHSLARFFYRTDLNVLFRKAMSGKSLLASCLTALYLADYGELEPNMTKLSLTEHVAQQASRGISDSECFSSLPNNREDVLKGILDIEAGKAITILRASLFNAPHELSLTPEDLSSFIVDERSSAPLTAMDLKTVLMSMVATTEQVSQEEPEESSDDDFGLKSLRPKSPPIVTRVNTLEQVFECFRRQPSIQSFESKLDKFVASLKKEASKIQITPLGADNTGRGMKASIRALTENIPSSRVRFSTSSSKPPISEEEMTILRRDFDKASGPDEKRALVQHVQEIVKKASRGVKEESSSSSSSSAQESGTQTDEERLAALQMRRALIAALSSEEVTTLRDTITEIQGSVPTADVETVTDLVEATEERLMEMGLLPDNVLYDALGMSVSSEPVTTKSGLSVMPVKMRWADLVDSDEGELA